MPKKNEDRKAILARRDAFLKKVLSNEEKDAVKGGAPEDICLTCNICLSIVPCYVAPCYVVPAP